jgi:hypothetical protein
MDAFSAIIRSRDCRNRRIFVLQKRVTALLLPRRIARIERDELAVSSIGSSVLFLPK